MGDGQTSGPSTVSATSALSGRALTRAIGDGMRCTPTVSAPPLEPAKLSARLSRKRLGTTGGTPPSSVLRTAEGRARRSSHHQLVGQP